jgi:hypothetical protein
LAENAFVDMQEGEYNMYIRTLEEYLGIRLIFVNEFWQTHRTHHNHTTDWQLIHNDKQLENAYNKLEVPFNRFKDVFEKVKQIHRYFYDDKVLQECLHLVDENICANILIPATEIYLRVVHLRDKKIFSKEQIDGAYDKLS